MEFLGQATTQSFSEQIIDHFRGVSQDATWDFIKWLAPTLFGGLFVRLVGKFRNVFRRRDVGEQRKLWSGKKVALVTVYIASEAANFVLFVVTALRVRVAHDNAQGLEDWFILFSLMFGRACFVCLFVLLVFIQALPDAVASSLTEFREQLFDWFAAPVLDARCWYFVLSTGALYWLAIYISLAWRTA